MKTSFLRNLKWYQVCSPLLIIIGVVLLIFMIIIEGEPGAVPLVLISAGVVWFITARRRADSRRYSTN